VPHGRLAADFSADVSADFPADFPVDVSADFPADFPADFYVDFSAESAGLPPRYACKEAAASVGETGGSEDLAARTLRNVRAADLTVVFTADAAAMSLDGTCDARVRETPSWRG